MNTVPRPLAGRWDAPFLASLILVAVTLGSGACLAWAALALRGDAILSVDGADRGGATARRDDARAR